MSWLSQGWRLPLGDCPLTLYVPTKNLQRGLESRRP